MTAFNAVRLLGDVDGKTPRPLMRRAVMLEFEGKSYRLKGAAPRIALSTDA
jgi:hypothetical protein